LLAKRTGNERSSTIGAFLRVPQQLNHRLHAVIEGLTIDGRHFPT
jgi:hypothetical protein